MNTRVRVGALVIALGLAGLLTGCVSNHSQTGQRVRHANDFEVVETSTKRNLTPKEMAELRAMVAEYLAKEGATGHGDYYVKVFLTPEAEGVPAEWVVVRYSRETPYTATRFALLPSYPNYYDSYSSYYSYDYYPFSYYGFGRMSFQYYDDPYYYYGHRNYYPRRTYSGHGHHGNRGHDRDRDRDRDEHRPPHGNRPPGSNLPTGDAPRVTNRQRWDSNSPERSGQPRENNFPNRTDTRQRWRDLNTNTAQPAPPSAVEPLAPAYTPRITPTGGNSGAPARPSRVTTGRERNTSDDNRSSNSNRSSIRPAQGEGGRERNYTPPSRSFPARPSRDVQDQNQNSSRQVQTTAHTPSVTRSEPASAPAYSPPATRSEPMPERSQSSGGKSDDNGRRSRLE